MELLTEKQVSDMLNVSESTLRRWRKEKKYLIYYRIGGGIKYRKVDVDNYLRQSRCTVDSEAPINKVTSEKEDPHEPDSKL